jgi:spore coat protein A
MAMQQMTMQHGALPSNTQLPSSSMAPITQATKPLVRYSALAPYVDALPLSPRAKPVSATHPHKLRIAMREIHTKVHRDVPPTRMWSYGEGALGPLIEARSGQKLEVEWVNELPTKHFLPIDYTLHGCGHDVPDVRACVHLHGARAPSKDDGQPDDWYVPGKSRICTYPMEQDATALWYHDHAMGINRLNIYAGLIGMTLIRDAAEDALQLPSGKYEIPLVFYDREIATDGELYYYDSGIEGHPWVSEFSGGCLLVNGKIKPYCEVEPRMYRLRMLNAANSSFFNIGLSGGHTMHQIGSDQGLLAAPVTLPQIMIAPAERMDVLVDFSQMAGENVQLQRGLLPIMQFRVGRAEGVARTMSLPTTLRPVPRTPESSSVVTRTITLNEALDRVGNSMFMLLNYKHWHEPVTEKPNLNTTEIWEFVNLTEDAHPMHLHLVRFQVLDRRTFDVFRYRNGQGKRYISEPMPPTANESGWKDVVVCPPGMITRIIAKFEGYAGKYLYHCHILEHEANDMMRPFEVVA